MNISSDILKEAKKILEKANTALPAPIKVGGAEPVFFVCKIDDMSVDTHTTIAYDEKIYKIGTKKSQSVS